MRIPIYIYIDKEFVRVKSSVLSTISIPKSYDKVHTLDYQTLIMIHKLSYTLVQKRLFCHIVNFEFTRWVLIQNLQYDSCHIVNFVFTPTQ